MFIVNFLEWLLKLVKIGLRMILNLMSNEILNMFTDKKILWGSDWPVCNLRTDYLGWYNTAAKFN